MEILEDCDRDTLLIKVNPEGPVCHTGSDTCFEEVNRGGSAFLAELQELIHQQKRGDARKFLYHQAFSEAVINKMAQKVGEEAVELVIEAKDSDDALFLNEAADLVYHLMVLLSARGYGMEDVAGVLEQRHRTVVSVESLKVQRFGIFCTFVA